MVTLCAFYGAVYKYMWGGEPTPVTVVPAAACGKRTGRPDLLFLFFESFSASAFLHVCACVCEGRGGGIHFNQPDGFP